MSEEELTKLRAEGIWCKNYTKNMVKERLLRDANSENATASLSVSLLCPLGQRRMEWPCRAFTCCHLQCFDASLYIQMNQKKPTWICPLCAKAAPFDSLMIDGLFKEILNETKENCTDIEFFSDGSWRESQLVCEHITDSHCISGIENEANMTVTVSPENLDESEVNFIAAVRGKKSKPVEAVELTLDSSSDEEEPSKKKVSVDKYMYEFLNGLYKKEMRQLLSYPSSKISVPVSCENGKANSSTQSECVTID